MKGPIFMPLDVVDLREFYVSSLGRHVRKLLRRRLARLWPSIEGEDILALGYATPLLRPWLGRARCLMAMMPASQGVVYWPREGPNISCLAELANLPLSEESVSRIVMLHALENAANPEAVLKEAWRVLAPGGRVLLIVPNRRGMWSHRDHTPFGTGRPYSLGQIKELLKEQGFLVEKSLHALHVPPWTSRGGLILGWFVEKLTTSICPAFGGVLIVEASKQIYSPLYLRQKDRGRRLVLPLPFPASSKPLPTPRSEH